jgi:hypothetical protein
MSEDGPGGSRAASDILSAAEQLAEQITSGARAEADAIRARAGGESQEARAAMRERIGRLGEMADAMASQLGQMRAELEALRGSVGGEAAATPAAAPEPVGEPELEFVAVDPAVSNGTVTDPDEVTARIVALDMAMRDTPREETARYLREHHDALADPERLLDEVYAHAGRIS